MTPSDAVCSVFITNFQWYILMRSRAVGIDKRQNGSAFIGQFYSPVVEHFHSVLRFRPAPSPAGGEALCRTFFQSVLRFAPSPAGGEASTRADQPKPSPLEVSSWCQHGPEQQSCVLHDFRTDYTANQFKIGQYVGVKPKMLRICHCFSTQSTNVSI